MATALLTFSFLIHIRIFRQVNNLDQFISRANPLYHRSARRASGDNPLLYTFPASDFTDFVPRTFGPGAVTLANNSNYGSGIAGMAVTAGYDLATGLGSPNAYNFVHDLANALH